MRILENPSGGGLCLELDPGATTLIAHQNAIDAVLIDAWLHDLVAGSRSHGSHVGEGEERLSVI